MTEITFRFPELPPSVNELYRPFIDRGGHVRIRLTKPGKAWKNRFVSERGGLTVSQLSAFEADQETEYELHLWFLLEHEELYTYGANAKSVFQKIDTSNLVKLVEDCIAGLVDVNDRANFSVLAHKRLADDNRGVVALVRQLDTCEDPYPVP